MTIISFSSAKYLSNVPGSIFSDKLFLGIGRLLLGPNRFPLYSNLYTSTLKSQLRDKDAVGDMMSKSFLKPR